ncbi:putative membrane protein [Serinicoccus hydrothermalis]|uniref:Putative membrane protein n=1 Tax=Serinicoccus hydrothermalis TaxID=1758689 RepID=A0A1B1NA07_9MICO|nr:YggT family protein [Serinicoccus hydrothermalis]ANS78267.1 putative membrane protein [Serinicoccus hydrothermalis]
MVGQLLALLLNIYFFVLIARLVFDWVQVFARDWRPKGPVLVLANGIYSLTDPPLRALRRVIPPLRIGQVALDLGFLVLIIAVGIGRSLALSLPF